MSLTSADTSMPGTPVNAAAASNIQPSAQTGSPSTMTPQSGMAATGGSSSAPAIQAIGQATAGIPGWVFVGLAIIGLIVVAAYVKKKV